MAISRHTLSILYFIISRSFGHEESDLKICACEPRSCRYYKSDCVLYNVSSCNLIEEDIVICELNINSKTVKVTEESRLCTCGPFKVNRNAEGAGGCDHIQ